MSRNRFWTLPLLLTLMLSMVLSCTLPSLPFRPRATPTPTTPPLPATHPLLMVRSPGARRGDAPGPAPPPGL